MKKLLLFFILLGALYYINTTYAHDPRVSGHNIRCVPNAELYVNGLHEAVIENNTNDVQPYYYEFKICIDDKCQHEDGYVTLSPHISTTRNGQPSLYFKCNSYPGKEWPLYLTTRISGETSAEKTIQGTVTVING